MIGHDRATELAASALDFALGSEDREELHRHLDECPACRLFDEHLRADAVSIADAPPVDAADGLRVRILATSGTPDPREATPDRSSAGSTAARPLHAPPVISPRYRRPAVVLALAAVIVAIVGGTLFWRQGPTVAPGIAGSSPSAPSSASSPAASGEPGQRVADETWTPVAELTAVDQQGGVVGLASGFRLTSLDGTPARDLADRLRTQPPILFAVTADADGRSAMLTPDESLTSGAVYRFTLTANDGRVLDSWAFQTHQSLQIVSTVPNDRSADVPLDTGIEVEFDQDGVVDAASHVTIAPKVDGRFETHGRVLAFVPARPLKAKTIYTVSISRGVEVGATGEALESDVRFQFETAAAGRPRARTWFEFQEDVVESATADRPLVAVWPHLESSDIDHEPAPPKTVRIEVHRLRDLDGAIAAYRQIRSFPDWAVWSAVEPVPTTGLTSVVASDVALRETEDLSWLQLPKPLSAGWYLVTIRSGTRPTQTILQVTDIAGYLVVSETKTLIWANDLANGKPLDGAIVAAEGTDLGRTGADGTVMADTPAALTSAQDGPPVVTVRSGARAAFLPASGQAETGSYGDTGCGECTTANGSGRYWNAFDTDRTMYRRTDTINAWGVVRTRDTGEVPGAVAIRLYPGMDEYDPQSSQVPALITAEARPNANGAFTASVALRDVPEGPYVLELRAGADVVAERWVRVSRIIKPAYRLEVTTGRRVYFLGDTVKVTATATFYEGSPVPGVPLRVDGLIEKTFKTDETGTAVARTTVRFDGNDDYYVEYGLPDVRSLAVSPARAEEGEINGASRSIIAFPSTWAIDGTTHIAGGRVRVTASLHEIDRDRLEREISAGKYIWELDPAGDAVNGKSVTATFTEMIPHRQQSGTRYDFFEKKVVPVYEYTTTERAAGTVRVTTSRDGSFSASVKASAAGHAYRVRLSTTDPDGHATRWVGWASEPGAQDEQDAEPALVLTSDRTADIPEFGVGEPIDLTMTDPGVPGRRTDRYLFYTAQRGLRDVDVQASERYRTTFEAWAPPAMYITGIRFTGAGYVESPTIVASFRQADREISVALTTDAARYDPGAEVSMTVTTRNGTGAPVPATVVLRAVDEKLFTIGGAEAADPLGELYGGLGSGILATYRSHDVPRPRDGEDTAGGDGDEGAGDRDDFRDSVLFREVDTGQDGRADLTFRVSDDLTSWRVSASAFGDDLTAGEASIGIPVGLPFFVDATIAPEYLVSDRPSIGLRTFGTALAAGSTVTFTVDSDSLGLHKDGLRAKAFETETVALPKLTVGTHRITITGSTGRGSSARRDVMTRTLTVAPSRLTRTRTDYVQPSGSTRLEGGAGLVDVVVSDASAARYVQLLLGLTGVDSARLERTLAAALAGALATDRFDVGESIPPTAFDGDLYQTGDGGLALLPYSSSNLEASALAALVGPQRFDAGRLAGYLSETVGKVKETRERRNVALAGLGGLHAAVLPLIRAAAEGPGLIVRERLWLGLGAAALGDAATARSIGAGVTAEFGEIADDRARLRVGDSADDITAGTALMAMLAAANGDPLAPKFWAYVEADPGTEVPYALHAVGYVTRMLEREAPRAATFAYTIGDTRQVVELHPGGTFRMALTDAQLASLVIEPVSGQIGVSTHWRETVTPSAFKKDPDIAVSRRMTPSGKIDTAALVKVDITVRLGAKAPLGCHLVTDIVPSGLVPVGNLQGWVGDDEERSAPSGVQYPYGQVGQRVTFCAERGRGATVVRLRYFARVVTGGTYAWEPTIVESRSASGRAAITPATVVTIR